MSKLKVLQIAHDHPAFTQGGTEWIAHDLTRALAERGTEARLLAATTSLSRPDAAPGALERHGEDWLLRTGAYDAFSMTRQDGVAWAHALAEFLDDMRPDVVHLHGLDRIGAEVVGLVRAHLPRARIMLTLHDYQLICARDGMMVTAEGALCHRSSPDGCRRCLPELSMARHALRDAHLKGVLSGVDLFVSPSRFLKRQFAEWGLPSGRIVVVPNGVATPGRPRLPERGDRFAFFGSIADHKGVHILLDAAARLADSGAGVSLSLHGGFTWRAEAERARFAEALGRADRVARHRGPYAREDLPRLMAATDWVVVPSTWWENAPLVILEAQAAGRPVICSGIGGMAELVDDGVTGLHVPPGDAAALADTMESAATAELCRRLAANIRPPASVSAMAEAHLDLYGQLIREAAT